MNTGVKEPPEYSSTEPLEPRDDELDPNVKAEGAHTSSSPTAPRLSAVRDDWEVFSVPEAVLTFAGQSSWKIGSGSGSGAGVKVLLCAGRNVDAGGGLVLLTDEERDSFNGESL